MSSLMPLPLSVSVASKPQPHCTHEALSSSRIHILTSEAVPGGCTMATVGASCEVHLMLHGLVDVEKEVTRLEDKIEKLNAKVNKLTSIENYEEKVCMCVCTCVHGRCG